MALIRQRGERIEATLLTISGLGEVVGLDQHKTQTLLSHTDGQREFKLKGKNMMNLNRRIARIEKSLPPEPKERPAIIFVNPGETKEQKIAEFETEHDKTFDNDYDWILQFAAPETMGTAGKCAGTGKGDR